MEAKGRSVGRLAIVIVVALVLIRPLAAQRRDGRRFGFGSLPPTGSSLEYDGRFTIVRLWYPHYGGWSYDYPDMEQNHTDPQRAHLAARAPGRQQHPQDG